MLHRMTFRECGCINLGLVFVASAAAYHHSGYFFTGMLLTIFGLFMTTTGITAYVERRSQ